MNVISAIFALLGIVAFIVDLNLNGLYRSSYCTDLVLVKSHLAEYLGTPPGLFSSPQGVLCLFPNPCWGGGFSSAGATYFRLVPREMSHPLEASTSHKNGGWRPWSWGCRERGRGSHNVGFLLLGAPGGC